MKWQSKDSLLMVMEWVVNVSRVAIIVTSAQWLLVGELLWFAVGAVSFALTFIPPILIRDRLLQTSTKLCTTALLAAHIVLGMQFGWYETSVVYDKFIHALGSGAVTALVIVATVQHCQRIRLALPLSLLIPLVLGIAISAGVVWEMFEFTVDRTGLFHAQRGLSDTMLDLIADSAGVVGTLALYVASTQRNNLTHRAS